MKKLPLYLIIAFLTLVAFTPDSKEKIKSEPTQDSTKTTITIPKSSYYLIFDNADQVNTLFYFLDKTMAENYSYQFKYRPELVKQIKSADTTKK
jgi:hypothetical protein